MPWVRADHDLIFIANRLLFYDRDQLIQARHEYFAAALHLHAQGRIADVGTGQSVMHPATGRPHVLAHIREKGDHVVLDFFFDFENARDLENRLCF